MLNRKAKFWLFVLIVGAIVWLGAINIRFLIGNDLLNYDEFNFRTSIPPDEENMIFRMLSHASLVVISAYLVTLISSVFFIRNARINVKENPWFLMCAILFYIFVPVELYTYYLDLKFYLLYLENPPTHDGLLKLFGERIGFLKGVPWIAVLCYYAIIAISVYQPMKKSREELLTEQQIKLEEYSYKYYMHEDDDIAPHK